MINLRNYEMSKIRSTLSANANSRPFMGVTSGHVAHVHSNHWIQIPHPSEASMSSTSISSKGENSSSSSTISTNPGMLAVGLRKLWISKRGGSGMCDTILRIDSNRFENDSRFKYYISTVQHWSIWEVEILPYGHMYVVYLCTVLYYQYIHIFACIKRLVWY